MLIFLSNGTAGHVTALKIPTFYFIIEVKKFTDETAVVLFRTDTSQSQKN